MKQLQIFVFGDSITYGAWDIEGGWVAQLRKFLDEKRLADPDKYEFIVYNLGISGNDTYDLLERFEFEIKQRLDKEMETIVVFAIGENDAQFIHSQNSLRTTPDMYQANLQKLLKKAQAFTSKIVFVGLTPANEPKTTPIPWNKDKSYTNANIAQHSKVLQSFCKENKIPLIDFFNKWLSTHYLQFLDADGLHPNSEGHQKIYEAVKPILLKYL